MQRRRRLRRRQLERCGWVDAIGVGAAHGISQAAAKAEAMARMSGRRCCLRGSSSGDKGSGDGVVARGLCQGRWR